MQLRLATAFLGITLANVVVAILRLPESTSLWIHRNLTNEPAVLCENHPILDIDRIQECEAALELLPRFSVRRHFGPDELSTSYRTPIRANRGGCDLLVRLRPGYRPGISSWSELREAFGEVLRRCLYDQLSVGFARVGALYELEVRIRYTLPRAIDTT